MDLSAHRSALKFTSLMFVILLFFLGLSLSANVLAWLRIEDLERGQKETYIPMFFNQPFSLSRNVADASYLQQVAESLMFLRLNVTPESIKAQHQALLRYFDTAARPQMKEILDGEASQIITNNVSSAFYMTGIDVYRGNDALDSELAKVVQRFSEEYGIALIPVSMDGARSEALPQTRPDGGQSQRLGVTHLPALYLVEPGAERYQPLAYGFMTQDDLMKRFLSVATDFAPQS